MWLQSWREVDRLRSSSLICKICDREKLRRTFGAEAKASRSCFYAEKEVECTVVKLDQNGQPIRDPNASDPATNPWAMETRIFDRESLVEYLVKLEDIFPDEPPISPFGGGGIMSVMGLYNPYTMDGICPRSLEDPSFYELMDAEGHCAAYHLAVVDPPVFEAQPRRVMSAFRIIRGVRNEFQIRKMEEEAERQKKRQEALDVKNRAG